MPSRRRILRNVAVGTTWIAGCSQTETGRPDTDRTETTATQLTQATTAIATETQSTTEAETETEHQCTESWQTEPVWRLAGQGAVNGVVAGTGSTFVLFDDAVTALDAATANVEWKRDLGKLDGVGGSAPSFRTDTNLVVCGSRYITALDVDTGSVQWTFTIPGKEETASIQAATVHNGVIYVGAINAGTPSFEPSKPYARLYSIDVATGTHRTFVEVATGSDPPTIKSVIADNRGVYADIANRLVAFSSNGDRKWSTPVQPTSTPVLSEETVIVPTRSAVVAVDTATGTPRWKSGRVHRAVALGDGMVYAPMRSSNATGITAMDVSDGSIEWEVETAGKGGQPRIRDGVVYQPINRESDSDLLMAFDADSGCRLGNLVFDSEPLYTFDIGTEHVFAVVGVTDGELRTYELPNETP